MTDDEIDAREYERGMFRSGLVSLFWAVISERKKGPSGFTLQSLADKLGVNKGQVSRWFNGLPNWEANTVADISDALEVDLQFIARDRRDGRIYSASGVHAPTSTASVPLPGGVTNAGQGPEATGYKKSDGFTVSQIAA